LDISNKLFYRKEAREAMIEGWRVYRILIIVSQITMKKSRIPVIIIGFCIPVIAILVLFPLYNRAEPFVLGFPFVYFWLFIWLLLTSLCLFVAYRIDPYNKPDVLKNFEKAVEEAREHIKADDDEEEEVNAK
jgi:hypothetical protein